MKKFFVFISFSFVEHLRTSKKLQVIISNNVEELCTFHYWDMFVVKKMLINLRYPYMKLKFQTYIFINKLLNFVFVQIQIGSILLKVDYIILSE